MKFSYLQKNKKKMAGIIMAMIVSVSAISPVYASEDNSQVQVLEEEEDIPDKEIDGDVDDSDKNIIKDGDKVEDKEDGDDKPSKEDEEDDEENLIEGYSNLISVQRIGLSGDYDNGTYEGTGEGFKSDIVLEVTIADNAITNIEIKSQAETPEKWSLAKDLIDIIIGANSTDVDVITTATYSSNGIKDAVDDALSKAIKGETKVFEDGNGSKKDPYIIATDVQMKRFAAKVNAENDYEGKYIELSDDINLSGEWTPIGTKAAPFTGNFSGEGNTIDGLVIETSNEYAGLFGYLGEGAKVSDIKLTNVNISEDAKAMYAGGIAAYADKDASIVNCNISGDINSDTLESVKSYAGGIVGFTGESVTVDNCNVSGSILSNSVNALSYAGGIAGSLSASSIISNSYVDASVKAYSEKMISYAGGIVGSLANKCVLINLASEGAVEAQSDNGKNTYVGGIAGMIVGTAYNVFTRCEVSAISSDDTKKYAGAISGAITPNVAIVNAYYDNQTDVAYKLSAPSVTGFIIDNLVGVENSELDSQEFVEMMNEGLLNSKISSAAAKISDASNEKMGNLQGAINSIDGVYTWELDGTVKLSDEIFVDDTIDSGIFDSGSGKENDPYIIKNEEQIRKFALSVTGDVSYSGIYIALGDNIDVSSEVWSPVGLGHHDFLGTFDGKGYKITGMHIGEEGNPYKEPSGDSKDESKMTTLYGFFGMVGENAVIKNLGIEDAVISVEADFSLYAGLLAGSTERAYIDSCYTKGYVYNKIDNKKGNAWAGGLVGKTLQGGVINSWADTEVYCEAIGGLAESGAFVGMNNRTVIANCFALGNTGGKASREDGNEGMPAVSSFIGVNGGKMANCYSIGDMKADSFTTYVGSVSGWATGIARQFISYYSSDANQNSNGVVNTPVISVGFMVSAGVNDEGLPYDGTYNVGIEAKTESFIKSEAFADLLNSNFNAFPLDIVNGKSSNADDKGGQNDMGLPSFMKLKTWELVSGVVMPVGEEVTTTYKDMTPVFEPDTLDVLDGTYSGRAEGPSGEYVYIQMIVADKRISAIDIIEHREGSALDDVSDEVVANIISSQNYAQEDDDSNVVKSLKAAIAVAAQKASIRDTTGYENVSDSIFASGDGTEKNPYMINTAQQLGAFAESVNAVEHYEGKYVKLGKDISLKGIEWIPVGGSGVYGFRGTFDGNNKVISDMTIGSESNPEMYCKSVGLFSNLEAAKIKNLGIENAAIYHRYLGSQISYAGILSGYYIENPGDGGYIDFCYAEGTVNSYSAKQNDSAGLVGNINRGTIANSYVDVTINSQSRDGYSYAGGISALSNRALIINCYSSGNINSSGNGARMQVGGIFGMNAGIAINTYSNIGLASANTTIDIGGISGRISGIAYLENAYYNEEATQVSGSQIISPAKGIGTIVSGAEGGKGTVIELEGKTLSDLKDKSFAELLNSNKNDKDLLSRANEIFSIFGESMPEDVTLRDFVYSSKDGGVVFKDRATKSSSGGSGSGSSGSHSGGSKTPDKTNNNETPEVTNEQSNQGTPNISVNKPFTDTQNHWASEAINRVVERKIFAGVSENEFAPNNTMTRAMFVTVIGRLVNAEIIENSFFGDVQSGTWYSGYVGWASQQNIVSGISSTEFGINEDVTREQMAVMLYNLAKAQGLELSEGNEMAFNDNDSISGWAKEAVSSMVEAGIMSGRDDNTFDPQQKATRAEAASMIVRFMDKYNI